jgi:8-oxo-dGTP pyrophosphatase MutT (NUDIX family)
MEVLRTVASLAIYNTKTDKILVQDRTSISKFGEEVTFFGGGLDGDEIPLQAAQRESTEELGLVFDTYHYLWEFSHDKQGKAYIRHLFFVPTTQEKFDDMEWDGALWMSIEDAKQKKFTTDMTREFIAIEKYISENIKR